MAAKAHLAALTEEIDLSKDVEDIKSMAFKGDGTFVLFQPILNPPPSPPPCPSIPRHCSFHLDITFITPGYSHTSFKTIHWPPPFLPPPHPLTHPCPGFS